MIKVKYVRTEEEKARFYAKHQKEWTEIGEKIKKLREALHLSRCKLAKLAGICDRTLKKLENGQYITRYKAISKSCLNALENEAYKTLISFSD